MKYLFTLITLTVFCLQSKAQVPQAFSFQSIVVDSTGEPLADQAVGVKIDILDGSMTGDVVYSETHTPLTNMSGIYSINIGQGVATIGSFAQIPWSSGDKYISLSQDVDGGTNYVFAGANQLLSVPYALVAGNAQVKPLIYVRPLIGNPNNVLSNEESDARINIGLTYQWIQGIPEDVFIEYSNLPPNTHLYMYSELGNVEIEDFDNFTAKDTFFEGIRLRSNRLVRTDPSVDMVPGDYPVEITFRTANEVLATVIHPVIVVDGIPNDASCFTTDDAGVYTLIETSCPEIQQYLKSEIELTAVDDDILSTQVTIFESEQTNVLIIEDNSNCFYETTGEFFFQNQEEQIEGFVSQFDATEEEFTFDIDLSIEDLIDENNPPQNYSCKIKYAR